MGKVSSAEMAGSIVRRVREDKGMPRAELAARTGIGARTLYALETGESENFGLGNYLRILDVLGLSLSIDQDDALPTHVQPQAERLPWDDLADIWKLPGGDGR